MSLSLSLSLPLALSLSLSLSLSAAFCRSHSPHLSRALSLSLSLSLSRSLSLFFSVGSFPLLVVHICVSPSLPHSVALSASLQYAKRNVDRSIVGRMVTRSVLLVGRTWAWSLTRWDEEHSEGKSSGPSVVLEVSGFAPSIKYPCQLMVADCPYDCSAKGFGMERNMGSYFRQPARCP